MAKLTLHVLGGCVSARCVLFREKIEYDINIYIGIYWLGFVRRCCYPILKWFFILQCIFLHRFSREFFENAFVMNLKKCEDAIVSIEYIFIYIYLYIFIIIIYETAANKLKRI